MKNEVDKNENDNFYCKQNKRLIDSPNKMNVTNKTSKNLMEHTNNNQNYDNNEDIKLNTSHGADNPNPNPIKKENILDLYLDRLGYTPFQIIMILIVCMIFFVDGCEMIIINLLLQSLQKEWGLNTLKRSLLSSAVFFGFFMGSFVSGYLTNKYGRKNPTVTGVITIWLFTSCSALCTCFSQLFTLRILVGVGIGIVVPAATSLITEIIPTKYRSFVLNILWILYPLGIIYICYISMFFIQNHEDLEWRKICFVNSYTSIIVIFIAFGLNESPRYLLLKQQYEQAFEILDKIGKSGGIILSKEEKEEMIKQNEEKLSQLEGVKTDFNVKGFFEKKYITVSLLLAYLWFISSFISYGLLYILPKIFDNMSKHDKMDSLKHMISAMFILFFCPLFRGIISELKFVGRKNAMIVGFVGSVISGFACILYVNHLSTFSGFLKFFINTSLGIVSVYTSEVYPTSLRAIALGFGNSLTRLGGILTPFICELVESIFAGAPFYMFIISSITGVIACLLLPFETMGMALDSLEKCQNEEEVQQKKEKY
jgi:MFS family permease